MLADELNNQLILKKTIEKISTKNGSVSQGYMIVGDNDNNLLEAANILSKAILCPNVYKLNCDKCNICKRIDDHNYAEFKVITPINQMIKKEEIISLRDYFSTKPVEGKYQVYIINNVEYLGQSSANALLKFLEEPNSNVVAIFTTKNLNKVMETIISRSQIIKLNNVDTYFGIDYVQKSTGLSKEIIESYVNFLISTENNYNNAVKNYKNELLLKIDSKEALNSFLDVAILLYKDMINYNIYEKLNYFDKKMLNEAINKNNTKKLSSKVAMLIDLKNQAQYNVNINLFLMNLMIRIGEINDD